MKILVIVAHPNLDKSIINNRWKMELETIQSVTVHDLYEKYRNHPINVPFEQQLLSEHERIVFQFPFYWYNCPPLLKVWMEEVLTYGWAYGPGGNALLGKEFMLAISVGGPQHSYRAGGYNHYTISELTRPFQATANAIGMVFLPHFIQYGSVGVDPDNANKSVRKYVDHLMKETLNPRKQLATQLSRMDDQGIVL
ncbi:NAD(P)H-dependent oxidoreductase [Paenibacillus tyrfis]|uniref:General stress protein n=1 Tax=Paenibacillus tyrfis TaxID=1501230 RepID=A0A081NYW2_9BACL|nr:NAD(P)H-dependent oxidoreductase [Paenibacillus tyrfis]KEQ23635.1 general stress protein [Paenibacillus tyrfis]